MTDTVFILGAGFSFDASIPLLANFIERMILIDAGRDNEVGKLEVNDAALFAKALDIRGSMDGYHGRISFDDRNIEDILSMLAFNVMGGGNRGKANLDAFTKAISRTIELTCSVKHPGPPDKRSAQFSIVEDGPAIYRNFWLGLFKAYEQGMQLPSLVTFNYDLVLERSLFQVLIGTNYSTNGERCPFGNFKLNYAYKNAPDFIGLIEPCSYMGRNFETIYGTVVRPESRELNIDLNIDLLKLHGSLNFTAPRSKELITNPCKAVVDPYILPPISNKTASRAGETMWQQALGKLRNAKNVVFVGYSLPVTDSYMQFFIKAALGPNRGLEKIVVVDPVLDWNPDEGKAMRLRYEGCFSEQMRKRLHFQSMTTSQFIRDLRDKPNKYIY